MLRFSSVGSIRRQATTGSAADGAYVYIYICMYECEGVGSRFWIERTRRTTSRTLSPCEMHRRVGLPLQRMGRIEMHNCIVPLAERLPGHQCPGPLTSRSNNASSTYVRMCVHMCELFSPHVTQKEENLTGPARSESNSPIAWYPPEAVAAARHMGTSPW